MSAGRLVFALILILLGLLLLGANLGWVDFGFVLALWQLWPLLLVVVGVYLLLGRGRRGVAIAIAAAVVVIGLGVAVVAWQADWNSADLAEGRIVGPGASQVERGELTMNVGALDLELQGGSRRTVEGTYALRGDPTVREDFEDSLYTLTFDQEGDNWLSFLSFNESQSIDLSLGSDIEWTLEVDMGAASADLDLEDVVLAGLRLDAGASSVDLTVGEIVDGAEIVIDGGAGSYDLRLPEDLDITLTTDTGLSSTDIDGAFDERDDEWTYDGGGDELFVTISAGVSSITVGLY